MPSTQSLVSIVAAIAVFLPMHLGPVAAQDATPAPPSAASAVFAWQTGSGPEPLAAPVHLAVDPAGTLWVVDSGNSRFQLFTPDGRFLETWGTPGDGPGEFNFLVEPPHHGIGSVAFGPEGEIYVADWANFRIQKFDRERNFVTAWGSEGAEDGQFLSPISVTVDEAGNVYVADDGRDDIQRFDADGTFLLKFGGHGTAEGQLFSTGYLTVDDAGNIWVADDGNHRIQQFAPDGRFLTAWGRYGPGEGQFIDPIDVAVADDGAIYVADYGNNRVQIFDPEGRFLGQWGGEGTGEGQFIGPNGLTLDGAGHIYVADSGNNRAQKFRLLPVQPATPALPAPYRAELLWESGGDPQRPLDDPWFLCLNPAGQLWVVDGRNNQFQIIAPDGTFVDTWGTAGTKKGAFALVEHGACAFDAAGNLYVVDTGNHRLQKFGPDRALLTAWGSEGSGEGQFLQPA